MSVVSDLKHKIISGENISIDEALSLENEPLEELMVGGEEIRKYFCGNSFDFCSIINGKSGKCSEDCKYCAQSAHYNTSIDEYDLIDKETSLQWAEINFQKGIKKFSIVTAGKRLSQEDINEVCKCYQYINANSKVYLCASHGLLGFDDFVRLKQSGVQRYHNNLETSRNFFPQICSTHTYDDKIKALREAREAGLEICSGGIIGLGESFQDRVHMGFELRRLEVKSVPINIYTPIKGTPLFHNKPISVDEVKQTVAIFRFILPHTFIRIAGGRGMLKDKGQSLFLSGANAAISGDMLTTSGISTDNDFKMIKELGYEL